MRRVFLLFVLCFSLILIWDSADGQIKRRLYVGRLNWDQDTQGASWMSSVTSEGEDSPSIWYNWQPWPDLATDIGYHGIDVNGSAHLSNIHGKNLVGQKAYWVGATNWTAPGAESWGVGPSGVYEPGITYPVFVNDNGPVTLNSLINTPHEEFTPPASFRRVSMPTVLIDGAEQTPVGFPVNELSGFEVDQSLVDIRADGMVEGKWTDPIGVTFHQRQFAWTHPQYDAIILLEVTIKNTGDVNADIDGIEKPGQTLNNFWLGIKHYLGPPEGDWLDFGSFPEYNGQADNLLDYDPATRYFWSWDGDANDVQGDDQFDPRGGPIGTGETENPTGEFLSPDVTGYAILYVDGPDGDTDHDAGQPATFRYKEFRNMLSPVQGTGTMQEAYDWMSGNDGDPMYQTGHSGNPFQPLGTARPHYDPVLGVGPYTLAPNESLKVAIAFSTGAVPEPMAIALGDSVKNGLKTLAAAKQVIYDGGVDSIQARFARAQAAYDSYRNSGSFGVPMLPDPPGNLRINSGPKQVSLEWDPVGDAVEYRVYRAIGGVDGGRVYSMITETAETSYLDEGLTRGTSYYYYVTALDADGLESSHFFNRTNRAAIPVRPAQEEGEWVDRVRVVPNPFNIKGNTYLEESAHNSTGFNFSGGYREQNTLLFVNIPELCTIHIYNAVGDKIKTLEHTDGSGDERWSPVLTDDNIFPASGVYFYIIKATGGPLEGQTATGKFVMIR